jgi:hypothetical protein
MTDRRWQIRSSCNHIVGSAGTPGISGTYCEVAPWDGKRMWVRFGTLGFANGIFWAATKWVMQFGGSVMYETTDELPTADGPVPTNWTVAVLGTSPAPVSTVSSGWSAVESNGFAKFSEDEDLSIGCKALRRKLTSDIVFTGADWDFFLAIQRDPVRRCEEITIRRQWRCGGMWDTVWTGTFSTGSGEWNYDTCEFTVRPDPLDAYTCIMRAMNKKVNVLGVNTVEATAVVVPSLEFGVCNQLFFPGCTGITATDGTPVDEYSNPHSQTVPYDCGTGSGTYPLGIYWREKETTFCVGGSPVSPIGAGWVLFTNNCPLDGTAVYVRVTTIPWSFGDATLVESDSPIPIPPDESCAWTYVGTIDIENTVDPFCPGLFHHFFICLTSGDVVEFHRARTLQGIANYLLERSGCDQTEMVSDLLEWNPPGDAPGYAPGINYVDGSGNQYNAIVALQNSDAIDPTATNPATIGEMTLKELFTMLMTGPKMFWAIDAQGRVRIEHWIFWTTPVGLSVLNFTGTKSEPLAHVSLKSEVPRYERPKWSQAQGSDFVGADIEYSGPCVSTDGENDVKEYNAGPFMTDIAYIISSPNDINKQGFTLLATAFDRSTYNTILDHGALSGNFITNAPLSWANLERTFWTWDRFLPSGTMNRQPTVFDGIQPTIEQRNVFVQLCCGYLDFDSSERVQTKLGDKLGRINAFVKRAEFDEATDGLTLTLRYAY